MKFTLCLTVVWASVRRLRCYQLFCLDYEQDLGVEGGIVCKQIMKVSEFLKWVKY